jgi:arylsulfatase A-like enzyme
MNVIWIMIDSLRYDHVGANGNDWIRTPNLDRFASKSLVFERAYQLSFPTLPTRTDIFTGRYTFPRHGWGPLPDEDVTAAQRFHALGLVTQMFFDTYHLRASGRNYDRGFDGWEWIRGQEGDGLRTPLPREQAIIHPTRPDVQLDPASGYPRELSNLRYRRFESEYISPQTYTAAERWLEYHHDQEPFFLYVDSFDPHEPWDPPAHYVTLYDPGYSGEVIVHPEHYGFADELSGEQVRKMRLLYAGEVTMVDRWVGRLLQKIEDLRLLDNSMVVVTSDHGFLIGDNGRVGKSNRDQALLYPRTGDERYNHPWPFYRTVNQLTFMVHMPWMDDGWRTQAIVQPHDLLPTTLEWLGADVPLEIEGSSFLPVLKGESDEHRDFAITSFELMADRTSTESISTVTDGRFQLHFSTRPDETELHDLAGDGGEAVNVLAEHRDVAEDLHHRFYETIRDKVNDPRKAELLKELPI